MSRASSLVAASIALVVGATVAEADTFGGWQYTAPKGYAVQRADDHMAFTKVTGSSYCSLALFPARRADGTDVQESAYEWHNVVTHAFKATVLARTTFETPDGAKVAATTATLRDDDGNNNAAVHYVVMPPEMIGSALLTASDATSLRRCQPVAAAFVRGLTIDWSASQFTDPEARVETPVGRWAVAASSLREYTFAPDGTYRFHAEEAAASVGSDRVIDETGRYTLVANRLTLVPTRSTATVLTAGVAGAMRHRPLEKTVYTWGKRYDVDANEWSIILTSKKATHRDGQLPDHETSYRYSDHTKPAWKYPTEPGV